MTPAAPQIVQLYQSSFPRQNLTLQVVKLTDIHVTDARTAIAPELSPKSVNLCDMPGESSCFCAMLHLILAE